MNRDIKALQELNIPEKIVQSGSGSINYRVYKSIPWKLDSFQIKFTSEVEAGKFIYVKLNGIIIDSLDAGTLTDGFYIPDKNINILEDEMFEIVSDITVAYQIIIKWLPLEIIKTYEG